MSKSHRLFAFAASVVVAVLFLSCRDSLTPAVDPLQGDPNAAKGGGPPSSNVVKVTVAPASATLDVGSTVPLTATAYGKKNVVIPGATFAWSSSAPGVASVSSSGLVTGVSGGSATISATSSGRVGTSAITVTSPPPPPPTGSVLIAAGDIAQCNSSNDEATAAVVNGIAGTVALLGDNVYETGTITEYNNCYGPSWGQPAIFDRTKPAPGNHEYSPNPVGYYTYFGAKAGDPLEGYYSYDLGDWHIIALNSNNTCIYVSCAPGSAQEQWLRADLLANTKQCVLAYWHHPRFNSGASHGNNLDVAPFWDALYEFGAEIVLNGHEHLYERFAPQTPAGALDAATGIRQFTVGTGGRALSGIGTVKSNSQVRSNTRFGVLKLTLGAGTYAWEFKPIAGQTFVESGTGNCH